ncbi:Rho protein GDP-dissociation inhibitor [Sesbania bispinosa]|nr:Rho protein GDP-dissociation inhibitor [Sesbania bispinosa]
MGFDENKETGQTSTESAGEQEAHNEPFSRQASESSIYATEEEEDEDGTKIELGPQCTLKEQLEKDKDDESLRKWKEQLLGSVDVTNIGEHAHA